MTDFVFTYFEGLFTESKRFPGVCVDRSSGSGNFKATRLDNTLRLRIYSPQLHTFCDLINLQQIIFHGFHSFITWEFGGGKRGEEVYVLIPLIVTPDVGGEPRSFPNRTPHV